MTLDDALTPLISRLRARYLRSPLPAFLRWWRGHLSELLPASMRARLLVQDAEIWLRVNGDELQVWRSSADQPMLIGAEPLAEPNLPPRLDALLGDNLSGLQRILLIAPDQVLVRRLNLPLAAIDNLRTVLGFELDRQTPFRSDQVEFDAKVLPHDRLARQLRVDLAVLPLPVLQHTLKQVPDLVGGLDGIDAATSHGRLGFNLLPPKQRRRRSRRGLLVNLALAGMTLTFLLLAMLQLVDNRLQAVADLEAEVERQHTAARAASALRKNLDEAAAAANFLANRKAEQPSALELFKLLTEALPDDTYLENMSFQNGELTFSGRSAAATKLLEPLQKLPQLRNAAFVGAVQPDPRTGKEQFTISARFGPDAAATDAR